MTTSQVTSEPDATGHFGPYGGRFVPEVLMAPLEELEQAYRTAKADPAFQAELTDLLTHYAGRPTPLYYARRLSETLGGAKIYIKREDLLPHRRAQDQQLPGPGFARPPHGQEAHHRRDRRGAARRRYRHRLRAVRPGMRRLHGRRGHAPPGAERLPHAAAGRDGGQRHDRQPNAQGRHQRGHARLGDERPTTTHYLLGSALGAHPYPLMVRDFQSRDRRRNAGRNSQARRPPARFDCSPASAGAERHRLFHAFIGDEKVKMIGSRSRRPQPASWRARGTFRRAAVRACSTEPKATSCRMTTGRSALTHSVSAGLDYASVGPEHAWLHDQWPRRVHLVQRC